MSTSDRDPFERGFWRWFVPIYFGKYLGFSALAVVMFGLLYVMALFSKPFPPPLRFETPDTLFLLLIIPFFGPFAWMSSGYARFLTKEREQAGSRLFWRFNVLNGATFWVAVWSVGAIVVAVTGPQPHPMEPANILLSFAASLPILIGMSALASLMSFWMNLFQWR